MRKLLSGIDFPFLAILGMGTVVAGLLADRIGRSNAVTVVLFAVNFGLILVVMRASVILRKLATMAQTQHLLLEEAHHASVWFTTRLAESDRRYAEAYALLAEIPVEPEERAEWDRRRERFLARKSASG